MCDSRYGGLVPGAGLLDKRLVLAMTKAVYLKKQTTTRLSAKYRLQIGRWAHCEAHTADRSLKAQDDAKADSKVDSDMHFEILDTVQEEGKLLRHFRRMPSEAFTDHVGGKAASDRPAESCTEYWDVLGRLSTPIQARMTCSVKKIKKNCPN